jgi:hypothetical protein
MLDFSVTVAVPASVVFCLCSITSVLLYRRLLSLRKRRAMERLQLAGGGVAVRANNDHATPYFDRGSPAGAAGGDGPPGLMRLLDGLLMDVAQLHPVTGVIFFSFMAPFIAVVFIFGSGCAACGAARRALAACARACVGAGARCCAACCTATVDGLRCYALCEPECCGECLARHCCDCCVEYRAWCLGVRTEKERREFIERVRSESSFSIVDGEAAARAARDAAAAAAAAVAAVAAAGAPRTPPPAGLRAGGGTARLLAGGRDAGGGGATPDVLSVEGGSSSARRARGGGGGGGGAGTPPGTPSPARNVPLDRDVRQSLRRLAGEAPKRPYLSLRLDVPGAPPSLAQMAVAASINALHRAFEAGGGGGGGGGGGALAPPNAGASPTPPRERSRGAPARTRLVRQADGTLLVEEEVSDDDEEGALVWGLPAPLSLSRSASLPPSSAPTARSGHGGGGGSRGASPLPRSPHPAGVPGSPLPPRASPLPRAPPQPHGAAVAPAPHPAAAAGAPSDPSHTARSGASDPASGSRASPTQSSVGDALAPTGAGGGGGGGREDTADPATPAGAAGRAQGAAPSRAALNAVLRMRPQ